MLEDSHKNPDSSSISESIKRVFENARENFEAQ